MYVDFTIDYDEDEKSLFLSHNGSSGCEYTCEKNEVKNYVLEYLENDIFSKLD